MNAELIPEICRSPERDELRRTAAAFFDEHLGWERVRDLDDAGSFDRATWEAMAQFDAHGLGVPTELGGAGGSAGDSLVVLIELAKRFPSLAVDYVLVGMAARLILESGTDLQREAWLPGLCDGTQVFAFGLSEPGGGTDVLAGRTRAELVGGEWRVHGQKLWTSMGQEADVVFTLARTEDATGARAFSQIAVPLPQPGVEVRRVHLGGMRAAGTCELYFDGAVAPEENLLGDRGRGFHILRASLAIERILSAGLSLGIAYGALDLHIRYAAEREAFGRPIGGFQAIQHPIVDSVADLAGAALLVERAVDVLERGDDATGMAALAKLDAGEATARIVDRGMRAMGAHGYARESPMQMYFRDARLQLFSPISNEMIKNLLGEQLGLPRSY